MEDNDFNVILDESFLYKKEKDLEFYFNEKEGCIFIAEIDDKGSRKMIFSPERDYKFSSVKREKGLLFLSLKENPRTHFIYSLKEKRFLSNPLNKKSYSFYAGIIKEETFLIFNAKSLEGKHVKFCTLTHNFLSF